MNIIRYYNQNRRTIWIVIIAIILIIIAIHTLNNIVKINKKEKANSIKNIINEEEYKNNLNIHTLLSDNDVEEQKELIIDQFIRYCNAGKIEEAYNLLTENCKKELFPTIEIFKQNYYNKIFNTTKLYSKEKFIGKTYKIKLYEDILSTGIVNSKTIEDYYTIEKENNKTKINISNYIGEKEINKTSESKILKLNIIKKQIYKEYEEYEIKVTNLSDKTIKLDSSESTKTIYLKGEKNVKYYSLSHEIIENNLIIKPNETKTITIKFSKEYNSNNIINSLVFSDIILDYDLYQTKEKKKEYTNRSSILVNL